MKQLLYLLALLAISPAASAINRCSEGNRVWYQDMACPASASSTFIPPAAPITEAPLSGSGKVISLPQEASQPLPPPPSHIPAPALEREADVCLSWYRREMQLPAKARYLNFTKDRRMLTITLPVSITGFNHLGIPFQSTVNKQASCEIHNGQLDDSWTRIHAKRGGWIQ